jgi:hypothetical protein
VAGYFDVVGCWDEAVSVVIAVIAGFVPADSVVAVGYAMVGSSVVVAAVVVCSCFVVERIGPTMIAPEEEKHAS